MTCKLKSCNENEQTTSPPTAPIRWVKGTIETALTVKLKTGYLELSLHCCCSICSSQGDNNKRYLEETAFGVWEAVINLEEFLCSVLHIIRVFINVVLHILMEDVGWRYN